MDNEKPKLVTIKLMPEEVQWLKAALENSTIKGGDSIQFAELYKKITMKVDDLGL
tara:strand:- start:172 stop:336 length:165 start_codon:yes stop_codon:yes gene_type:complete